MGNELLTGLLNQTNGGNWWQGQSAPTTGYGSMPPPVSPTGEEGSEGSAGTTPEENPAATGPYGNSAGANVYNQREMAMQNKVSGLQRQIQQYQLQAAQYPPGHPYGDKIRTQMQQLMMQLNFAQQGG